MNVLSDPDFSPNLPPKPKRIDRVTLFAKIWVATVMVAIIGFFCVTVISAGYARWGMTGASIVVGAILCVFLTVWSLMHILCD